MKKGKKYKAKVESMNNTIIIVSVIALVIIILVVLYKKYAITSIGMDKNIKDENGKKGINKKVLVLYFSHGGNTQVLAKQIYDQVGGDLRRIEPVNEYPTGISLYKVSKKERDNNERPKFKDLNIDIKNYDTIFIGYPMWWYTLPQVIYTFFDEYDLSGKTIVPFNTHEGSSDGGTYQTIKELEPNAKILEGLPMRGKTMTKDQSESINKWLKEIGLK